MNTYTDDDIESLLSIYNKIGGVIDFSFFELSKNIAELSTSNYQKHLKTAIQTTKNIGVEINNADLTLKGIKISIEEFLGPFFDTHEMKPLIKGKTMLNNYFYYDQEEKESNITKIDVIIQSFIKKHKEIGNGFTYAFLEPPYGLYEISPYEKGRLFLKTLTILFSNINTITIYKWNTDASPYFNAGKEWWGCYFYTVYNPKKDIYIGITASQTD
ncbi:hypothetical protein PG911_18195 [Tenacibaculum ovolyticum]|uniref:hypothetical protein n=1 Tax=Tenacibaculum ovolyticum TaxID=104270 RepID=UPI0022F3DCF8|nr:hypothetical protein [Tenacibaculum ovolyticum]WBX76522.1 hypothetical protein PG911_18195 [Tenacibaculum ovolyticum]